MFTSSTHPWLFFFIHTPSSSTKLGSSNLYVDNNIIPNSRSITNTLKVNANAKSWSKINVIQVPSINQLVDKEDEIQVIDQDDDDQLIFRQEFTVRSYEIGADRTVSIETLMNHLQETSINHVKSMRFPIEGFGSTPEMYGRNLIWVTTRIQLHIHRYSTWEDVVEIETWLSLPRKHGMRRDWVVRDSNTGDILATAYSMLVVMNKHTRKFCKLPDEVRRELTPCFSKSPPVIDEDVKVPKLDDNTAQYICKGLNSKWRDLDINQHVNNVKYIDWILEGIPCSIFESHELSSMTLEYRRECRRDSVLQSLTAINSRVDDNGLLECQHLLRLEDGVEIVRGTTKWNRKQTTTVGNGSSSY